MNAPTRPILRYHGGKWKLAPWVIEHFPPHRVYVEPFCGAASVLAQKPRINHEVINDLNGRLVNLFRLLRDPAASAKLVELVYLTLYSDAEYRLATEPADDLLEDARRLLVLGGQAYSSCAAAGGSSGKLTTWRRRISE